MDDILLVLNDSRLIVPKQCRVKVLENLHSSHSGISKTKQLAKTLYYWPGMTAQITQLIQDCDECQSLRPLQHDNAQSHPPAVEPMHSVGLDLFECNGNHYLVMIDPFSNYIWVKCLKRLGTDSILKL